MIAIDLGKELFRVPLFGRTTKLPMFAAGILPLFVGSPGRIFNGANEGTMELGAVLVGPNSNCKKNEENAG
jgi:hypothetical protein